MMMKRRRRRCLVLFLEILHSPRLEWAAQLVGCGACHAVVSRS